MLLVQFWCDAVPGGGWLVGVQAGEGLGCVWEPLWGKQGQGGSQHPPPPRSGCFWSCHSRNDADCWCSASSMSRAGEL